MPHDARGGIPTMIDNFALALSHGLLLLAAWRLLSRPDLDDESGGKRPVAPRRAKDRPGA